MAAVFYSGKNGSIVVGGTSLRLNKWSLSMDSDNLDVTNFLSGGFKENISGLAGARIQASGPYPTGEIPIALGLVYTFVLGVGGAVGFTIAARVNSLSPSTTVNGVAEISISAESTGSFVPAIA